MDGGSSYNGYYLYIPVPENVDQNLRWEGTADNFPYKMRAFNLWDKRKVTR